MYDKLFLALMGSSAAHGEVSRRAFARMGLSEGQPKVLYILRRGDGLMQKDLAEKCGVRESTLTVLLRTCEARGLIRRERRATAAGKSALRVTLTDEGRRTADALEETVESLEEQGFRGFTAQERRDLLEMLTKVTNNLKGE